MPGVEASHVKADLHCGADVSHVRRVEISMRHTKKKTISIDVVTILAAQSSSLWRKYRSTSSRARISVADTLGRP